MERNSEPDTSTRQDTLAPLVPVATAVGSFWLRRTRFYPDSSTSGGAAD